MPTVCVACGAPCVKLNESAVGSTALGGPEVPVTKKLKVSGTEAVKAFWPPIVNVSENVMMALYVPGVVNVPLNTPLELNVTPGGRLPPVKLKLYVKEMSFPSPLIACASWANEEPKSMK